MPQVLVNVRITKGFDLSAPPITEARRRVESELEGRGRLLLRPSGTEPVIRVMVEGDEAVAIGALADKSLTLLGGPHNARLTLPLARHLGDLATLVYDLSQSKNSFRKIRESSYFGCPSTGSVCDYRPHFAATRQRR